MTDFKLLCCRLFERYPLQDYRIEEPGSEISKLNVLIIGSGNRVEPILHEVLLMGQMPDTELDVTVATPNAAKFIERTLTAKAPYLQRFVTIKLNGKEIYIPDEQDCLGTTIRVNSTRLSADSMKDILEMNFDCSYVIISTGKDEENRAIASACAEYEPDFKTLTAYVQRKEPEEAIDGKNGKMTIVPFGFDSVKDYKSKLENIAFNIHFGYSSADNERKTMEDIRKEFDDPYCYLSNLEAALHIKSKLACVGIRDDDPEAAAEKFFRCISEKTEIIDRLSAAEHSRWMISKLLDNYRPLDNYDLIYSEDGVTTHSSIEGNKWHCCLAACDRTGGSHLVDEDWSAAEKGREPRPGLDPLDRMTLNVHLKCGELAKSRANDIRNQLAMLRTILTNNQKVSGDTIDALDKLEISITQMNMKKKTVIPIYRNNMKRLCELVEKECGRGSVAFGTLSVIDTALAPLCEYISRKDYKSQDRMMIERIPYDMTHRCQPVLLKLMAERKTDNVFSAWQIEPEKLIYAGAAETSAELRTLQNTAADIMSFLNGSPLSDSVSFRFIVNEKICGKEEIDSAAAETGCSVIRISKWNEEALIKAFSEITDENKIDYYDVTGGEPLLLKAAEKDALRREAGIFYVRNGRFRNLSGAGELEYYIPAKSMTVREMLNMSGAVMLESESVKNYDLSLKYRDLWQTAVTHRSAWKEFSEKLVKSHKEAQKLCFVFDSTKPSSKEETVIQITDTSAAVSALIPMVDHISKKYGYIEKTAIDDQLGGKLTVSIKVNKGKVDPGRLQEFMQNCCNNYQPENIWLYESERTENPKVTYCNMNVLFTMENKDGCSQAKIKEYKEILEEMNRDKLILGYNTSTDSETGSFEASFRLASIDVLECLRTSGAVLEYYIYYTALFDSSFTDVDKGFRYSHSASEDAAENEIDVICTKGTDSLFISCKMVGESKANNIFNYFLYEIILQAEHFGVNAKPVLAAPAYSQFRYDKNTQSHVYDERVKNALRRGVYLLGKECFEGNELAQILDNIIEGKEDWCDCVKKYARE